MLVCIDLQALYKGLQEKKMSVDYSKLYYWLKDAAAVRSNVDLEVVAFGVSPENTPARQRRFFARLADIGYRVHTFPDGENFTAEMAAVAGASTQHSILFVTSDPTIARVCSVLSGKAIFAVTFFSEQLSSEWIRHLIDSSKDFAFHDMSAASILSEIRLVHEPKT